MRRPPITAWLLLVTALGCAAAVAPTAACSLRVLAFGDSLTEGFYTVPGGATRFHPYSDALRKLLRAALPASCHVAVHERGRSGEFVLRSMQGRLDRALAEAAANGEPYDWVLLLGGTNDIGTGEDGGAVLAALKEMHAAVAAAGSRLVAMTLPPFNSRPHPPRQQAYGALNGGLRDAFAASASAATAGTATATATAAASAPSTTASGEPEPEPEATPAAPRGAPAGGPPRAVLVDLEPLFPVTGVADDVKAATWSDSLHLTPAGYDRLAAALVAAMLGGGGGAGSGAAAGAAAPRGAVHRHRVRAGEGAGVAG
ncbi:MAG: SGNH hydrolase-type esterase domain-containing protein [Monoraphidium minutum]|nr:MAG: SGNH hydrolase-type esterase domain-containing protein [Monoraphidium minutum]